MEKYNTVTSQYVAQNGRLVQKNDTISQISNDTNIPKLGDDFVNFVFRQKINSVPGNDMDIYEISFPADLLGSLGFNDAHQWGEIIFTRSLTPGVAGKTSWKGNGNCITINGDLKTKQEIMLALYGGSTETRMQVPRGYRFRSACALYINPIVERIFEENQLSARFSNFINTVLIKNNNGSRVMKQMLSMPIDSVPETRRAGMAVLQTIYKELSVKTDKNHHDVIASIVSRYSEDIETKKSFVRALLNIYQLSLGIVMEP